jgi:hypothetical protein
MMVSAKSKYKEMENKGFKVVKIDIDIEELIEWCRNRKVTINPIIFGANAELQYKLLNDKLGMDGDFIRIASKDQNENRKILKALKQIL